MLFTLILRIPGTMRAHAYSRRLEYHWVAQTFRSRRGIVKRNRGSSIGIATGRGLSHGKGTIFLFYIVNAGSGAQSDSYLIGTGGSSQR
jgi:hypothetical protein